MVTGFLDHIEEAELIEMVISGSKEEAKGAFEEVITRLIYDPRRIGFYSLRRIAASSSPYAPLAQRTHDLRREVIARLSDIGNDADAI
jgi:hypothetical protein